MIDSIDQGICVDLTRNSNLVSCPASYHDQNHNHEPCNVDATNSTNLNVVEIVWSNTLSMDMDGYGPVQIGGKFTAVVKTVEMVKMVEVVYIPRTM